MVCLLLGQIDEKETGIFRADRDFFSLKLRLSIPKEKLWSSFHLIRLEISTSLLDDDNDSSQAPPPSLLPTEGRLEVNIDNHSIRLLDLTSFQTATGIFSPLSAEPGQYLKRTIDFTIKYTREDPYDNRFHNS